MSSYQETFDQILKNNPGWEHADPYTQARRRIITLDKRYFDNNSIPIEERAKALPEYISEVRKGEEIFKNASGKSVVDSWAQVLGNNFNGASGVARQPIENQTGRILEDEDYLRMKMPDVMNYMPKIPKSLPIDDFPKINIPTQIPTPVDRVESVLDKSKEMNYKDIVKIPSKEIPQIEKSAPKVLEKNIVKKITSEDAEIGMKLDGVASEFGISGLLVGGGLALLGGVAELFHHRNKKKHSSARDGLPMRSPNPSRVWDNI